MVSPLFFMVCVQKYLTFAEMAHIIHTAPHTQHKTAHTRTHTNINQKEMVPLWWCCENTGGFQKLHSGVWFALRCWNAVHIIFIDAHCDEYVNVKEIEQGKIDIFLFRITTVLYALQHVSPPTLLCGFVFETKRICEILFARFDSVTLMRFLVKLLEHIIQYR